MDEEWIKRESRTVSDLATRLKMARLSVEEEEKESLLAAQDYGYAVQAQEVLGDFAQKVQQKVHERISSVVSSCLSAVFDDPYIFKIHFERKRGGTVANLKFIRNGNELSPVDAAGGGAVDVAAFALRAACLVLHRPRLRPTLILDEPFKMVSKGFQPAVCQMLEQVSRDLKIQIILVTHNEAYETGKVIEL